MSNLKSTRSRQFHVYVIKLKQTVLQSAKFRSENPGFEEGKMCFYVGSTALSPEARAEKHRTGAASKKGSKIFNRFAHEYFDGLCTEICKDWPVYCSRKDAEKAEVLMAKQLRRDGFAVWQN